MFSTLRRALVWLGIWLAFAAVTVVLLAGLLALLFAGMVA